jgi:hypothetical protein
MKNIVFILFLLVNVIGVKAQTTDKVLEFTGSLASVAAYNTYITIGAIADGYVNDVYDTEYTSTLMDEQISMLKEVKRLATEAINESKVLSDDDKVYVMQLNEALSYLIKEAESLKEYAITGSDESSTRYSTNRNLAWDKISELLGIE